MSRKLRYQTPKLSKRKTHSGVPQGNEKFVIERIKEGQYNITDDYEIYSVRLGRVIGASRHKGEPRNTMFVSNGHELVGVEIPRVIYTHYKGEIPEGHVVVHKDGDKGNNDIANLELELWTEMRSKGGKKGGKRLSGDNRRRERKS